MESGERVVRSAVANRREEHWTALEPPTYLEQ
jgi:hypothetical protein